MSRRPKLLSKALDCPFLVLSQLSRATETRQGDHRPQLSDLRGLAELILAKQRNGPIGKVDLVFLHAQTRFENRAEDLGDAPGE